MPAKQEVSKIENIRHSLSHLLAAAVLKKFPDAKLGIGPVIENGFYYDFLLPSLPDGSQGHFAPDDLKELERTMRQLIAQNLPFSGEKLTPAAAKKLFKDQPFKLDLIKEFTKAKEPLSIYKTGDAFFDLCSGGHVDSTKEINPDAFKLDRLAGAYWRSDEKNPQLQRIYGLAFETKEELEKYLKLVEEAQKRDHRKLGKRLDLFTFSDMVGSGLPLWTPRGALVRGLLNEYVESLQAKAGYTQVWTPQIAKAELFKTSGHYDKYRESMFRVKSNYSDEEFFLKPMNCPQHTQIYASQPRSYRDLPLRYTDFAMLYRDEKPGELNGLARVRSFSQDDCHIFCREDQVDEEIDVALAMIKEIIGTFGLKYRYRLSTSDKAHREKYIGDPKTWDKLEKWAEEIMKRNGIEYFDGPGEAAFYGPKMDLMATDALSREWQLSTVQIDFFLPERFGLSYIDKGGKEKRPVMIHRAILGSPERFIMVLLEHLAGALPLWLAPTQAEIINVGSDQRKYAASIHKQLSDAGLRANLSDENLTVGKRIREAELMKIPYILVVGEKEEKNGTVNVRHYRRGQEGEVKSEKLIEKIKKEIEDKVI